MKTVVKAAPAFWVVIPAAGVGARMQADRPKQYLSLAGRSILEHTLDCFLDHPGLKGLVVCLAATDWVLVHDAARPNLAREDLQRLLEALADDPVGGLLALPARDTLKRAQPDGRVLETVDRSHVWQAFTPQMFRFGALQQALSSALKEGATITDEASAIELSGLAPRLIEGRADNLKVTRPEDLQLLRLLWASKG